jgi:hypothetical protein
MRMQGVSSPSTLRAAAESPEFRGLRQILARADIGDATVPVSVADLDARLKKSNLSIIDKMTLKNTLDHLGLLRV